MAGAGTTRAYWVEAAGRGALRSEPAREPGPGEVVLRAAFSGISPGTERLVGLGRVPAASAAAMACPGMSGSFALPVSYGYSLAGVVEGGPLHGRAAHVMHPHHERAVVAGDRLVLLPDAVSTPRATLLPNLETALNATWDAELAGDEPVAVVGAGAVGLLVAFVLGATHRGAVTLVDADAERRRRAAELGWVRTVVAGEELPRDHFAVVFHASGSAAGLQLALDALGFEGRVLELSWYGDQPVTLELGGRFHWQRQRIVASQVGTIAPRHRAAGRAARTAAVLLLLADARLDALLDAPVPFDALPAFFAGLYRGEPVPPCPLVAYPGRR
jgi:2-desacetyl-2-hydroxyethyl bacteriochlorophyllide A dehydrogenase